MVWFWIQPEDIIILPPLQPVLHFRDGISVREFMQEMSTGKTGQPLEWTLPLIWGNSFIFLLKFVPVLIILILDMPIFHPIAINFKYRPLYVRDRIALS